MSVPYKKGRIGDVFPACLASSGGIPGLAATSGQRPSHTRPDKTWLIYSICVLLAACGAPSLKPSGGHIATSVESAVIGNVPQPVKPAVPPPAPPITPQEETYSVVVENVPAQEVLFALARDAKINLDIHAGIQGNITLNAISQTLTQILDRIARQVDMRYELENGSLAVMPDTPYLKNYKIDYVAMSRDMEGAISNATQVGSGTSGNVGSAGITGNNSSLTIRNSTQNHFWETLTQNIKDILHETDKIFPEGSSETVVQQRSNASTTGTGVQPPGGKKQQAGKGIENSPHPATLLEGGTTVTRRSTFREAAAVIANPESGIITVRATGKQHEKIGEFIKQVMTSVRRQVLIEATVVEVRLSDEYRQGINWSRLRLGSKGFQLTQAGTPALPTAGTASMFVLDYANPASAMGNLSAQVSLLESFGKVKVLSSPKLSVLNNQTAVLRVVDNLIYFTVKADTTTNQTSAVTTYTTTANTVPIGFTMSVTPQINDNDIVLLNLRPSISRLLGYVNDPNPSLAAAGVTSKIPQTQTREMESVLKIANNQIAVLGGLMQDETNNLTDAVPVLSGIPLLGNLFKNRNDTTQKTELVIFLRPVVIKDAAVNGDILSDSGSSNF
jgi:MSHA biogenesis protein MshL